MEFRAVKCHVKNNSRFPENPNPKSLYGIHAALGWINTVGYWHVKDAGCNLPKCVASKLWIDKGIIEMPTNKKKAVINWSNHHDDTW